MSQREPPRKGRVLRAVCQEASEDHLGVALIRSGDSVTIIRHGSSRYEQKKVAASGQEAATRVEPRLEENVPCNRDIAGAFLLHFCAGSF